jgi:hypothetical protein
MHSNEVGHGNDEEPQLEAGQYWGQTWGQHWLGNYKHSSWWTYWTCNTNYIGLFLAIVVSQLVQHVVEPVSLENPQFPTMQSTPISRYSTKKLKEINMFFEQATHNVATWLGILKGLTNLSVECEKTKQTCIKPITNCKPIA